jgi:hypothetical protein
MNFGRSLIQISGGFGSRSLYRPQCEEPIPAYAATVQRIEIAVCIQETAWLVVNAQSTDLHAG